MMQEFFSYFHVEETNGVHRTLGHIHDTFIRMLPDDVRVYVGWEVERLQNLRYNTRVESPFADDGRMIAAFREVVASFGDHIRLGVLLSEPTKRKFVLLDIVES